jgi:hypothetical protein
MNRFRAEPARGIGASAKIHQYRSGLLLYQPGDQRIGHDSRRHLAPCEGALEGAAAEAPDGT